MKIATYNIHYGIGIDGTLDLRRVIDVVRDADIIALQEVESGWDRTDNTDQPALIREMLPEHETAWAPTIDVRKIDADGKPAGHGLRRQFGNMILSRYPILSTRNFLFPKYGGAQFLEMQKGFLEALIDTPLGPLRFYSTHLCNISGQQREKQMQMLLDHHRRAPDEGPLLSGQHPDTSWTSEFTLPDMPREAILCGDFNFEPHSAAYEMVAGEFSKRFGHLAQRGGFVDAWAAMNGEIGQRGGGTGGLTVLDGKNKRVDYCFVSTGLRTFVKSARVLPEAEGSDHKPIIVEFAR